jgi:hydroxypyruvate isomerase
MPKFNANLSMMFNEVDFLDRFSAAARAGFKGVEFLFPYAYEKPQLVDIVSRHNLEVVLFNMPPGDWNVGERGLTCNPSRVGEFQEGVGKAVDYARALNCKRVHAMAGLQPQGFSGEQVRQTYIDNLRFAGKACAEYGITLLIEAINTRDIPGFYLNYSRQALEILKLAEVPNLRFQYDIYHMQIMEGDLAPTIERCLPYIGHMQLADTPGRHEPGTGEIHYPFLFQHIDRVGYSGWIGCEYKPLGNTEEGLSWVRNYLGT